MTTATAPAFNKATRCDHCGAEAKAQATNRNLVLTFCGHHGRKHAEALTAQGFYLLWKEDA